MVVVVEEVVVLSGLLHGKSLGHGLHATSLGGQVLKHGGGVLRQHVRQVYRHGFLPEEIVIKGTVRVDALLGIKHEQFVE